MKVKSTSSNRLNYTAAVFKSTAIAASTPLGVIMSLYTQQTKHTKTILQQIIPTG